MNRAFPVLKHVAIINGRLLPGIRVLGGPFSLADYNTILLVSNLIVPGCGEVCRPITFKSRLLAGGVFAV